MSTIWDDPDVRDIIQPTGGQPNLLLGDLQGPPQEMILEFIDLDQQVTTASPAEVALAACIAGIRVSERFPDQLLGSNARGWKKFVIYMTAANAQILWEQHHDDRASAVGGWVLEALKAVGVQPDGFATALGTAYSSTMSIHGSATQRDPRTGDFVVRGGADGRALAGL